MLGIPLGLLYANASEWLIHKYVLHGLGKKKKSFFSFHWAEHHRACRKHEFYDPDYQRSVFGQHAQGKEALALAALVVLHAPLLPVAPYFTATVWYSAANYFYKHRRAHLDPEWAKKHLKHHYDHHMGREQDANWGVTRPWFDWLLGTRIDYQYDEQGRPLRDEDKREKPVLGDVALDSAAENAQQKASKSAAA
jgi:sterol desaturase/sphingolipid hydroxylase (fatty acid hydroxylase superfamily)